MNTNYTDDRFCNHCNAFTQHTCRDSGHERDSSGDEECRVCGWYSYGMCSEQSPPLEGIVAEDAPAESDTVKVLLSASVLDVLSPGWENLL